MLDAHGIATLLLTLAAIALFSRPRVPLETSALAVLSVLVAIFALFPYRTDGEIFDVGRLFSGFGHEALVSICGLMIVGRALERTGALQPVAFGMSRIWPRFPRLTLLATLLVGAVLSAFINNTPIVVMLLPMLVSVCLRTGTNTTGVLLPAGLATIIGGMSTTIGTSTNLLVVEIAADMDLHSFAMFDFALPVAVAGLAGIAFLWIVAPRMLPQRRPPLTDTAPRIFTGTYVVTDDSRAAGLTLSEARRLTGRRMRVATLERGAGQRLARLPSVVLHPGDKLIVNDTAERLMQYEQQTGMPLQERLQPAAATRGAAAEPHLAEVVVTAGSTLEGRKVRDSGLEQRFGLLPVALHRTHWPNLVSDIADERLDVGDVLLVQGERDAIDAAKASGALLVLDGIVSVPKHEKSTHALVIAGAVVTAVATGLLPVSVAAFCGVLAVLLTRCLTWQEATDALSKSIILVIVASLALGTALIETGGVVFLADLFLTGSGGAPNVAVVAMLMALMALVTNVVSNNAAAIIGTPFAADVAMRLGAPLEPFLLAVVFGANLSFATPVGYKTNILVMSAGGYRFGDFARVGVPLILLMGSVFVAVLAWLYEGV